MGKPGRDENMNIRLRDRYSRRLRQKSWHTLRKHLIKQAENKCSRCGLFRFGEGELHLHHKTYERLGKEREQDLEVVCKYCHQIADEDRVKRVVSEREDRLWYARMDGWATKKYGENWERFIEPHELEEEFEEWLEDREDE